MVAIEASEIGEESRNEGKKKDGKGMERISEDDGWLISSGREGSWR